MSLRLDKTGFPLIVPEEYKPVYDKFAETEVLASMPDAQEKAKAFVSYMQKIDRKVKFDFDNTVSEKSLSGVKLIHAFLKRNSLIYGLSVKEFKGTLTVDNNSFVNGLFNTKFTGVCRIESGKRNTVDNQLRSMVGTLFRNELPRQFNIRKNLKTVLKSKTVWVRLMTNPLLEMAVYHDSGKDGIILRYSLAISQIFFYGGKESSVSKLQSNIKRQIMARRIYEGL